MNVHEFLQKHSLKSISKLVDKSTTVYSGRRIKLLSCQIPDKEGKTHQRDLVVHPGAVVILPIVDDSSILMIKNQRFAVGEELWELPAGTLEPQEPPQTTAERELIEETGYKAGKTTPLTAFYTTPGFTNETMYAFVSTQLTFVGQALESGEEIIVEAISWKRALEMIKDGTIRDSKTISTLLFYQQFH